MAVGEMQSLGRQAHRLALARHDLHPVEAGLDVAAIGARVHRDRAADAARNAGEEFETAETGGCRMFGDRRIERGGTAGDATGRDLHG